MKKLNEETERMGRLIGDLIENQCKGIFIYGE